MSTIKAYDVIDRLPFELAARLMADEFFADIPVVIAEKGNIKLEMERKQAVITQKSGKRGVSVVVLQMVADNDFENTQFGPLTLKPAFEVVEQVALNNDERGTKKSARKVARRIRDVVNMLVLDGIAGIIRTDNPFLIPVMLTEANLVAYQCNFKCLESSKESIDQAQLVTFASAGSPTPQLQITCPTEGAVIYYTLDDTYPGPADALGLKPEESCAQIYTGPIDIPAQGFFVRACAYKSGLIASRVSRAFVNFDLTINR